MTVEEILCEYGFPADGEHSVEVISSDGDQESRLYQDGCESDMAANERPGFRQLLEDIKTSPVPIAAIEIESWSSLSRNPKIVKQMIAMAEEAGVPIRVKDDVSQRLRRLMRDRFTIMTYHRKST
jgi:DNA invertase Pin-like site-specific DNA recombinase